MIQKTYFKELREKRRITKEELAKLLKISEAQIDIIEKGNFDKLPLFVLNEILRRYKNFFKIPNEIIKEIHQSQKKLLVEDRKQIIYRQSFPNLSLFLISLLFIILFFIYQFYDLISPPMIKIIYPPDNFYSSNKQISIKGYVDKRSSFFINKEQIFYDEKGYFEKDLVLKPGNNKFVLEAINYLGVKNSKVLNIYYIRY